MINTVASGGTILARSGCDEPCVIDRSEKENQSPCERRIHREALNIFLELTG
jgi:hypothetical protein